MRDALAGVTSSIVRVPLEVLLSLLFAFVDEALQASTHLGGAMEWTAPTSSRLSTSGHKLQRARHSQVSHLDRSRSSPGQFIAIARGRGMRSLAASYARPSRHIA